MSKETSVAVEDIENSHIRVILGDSYVVASENLSPVARAVQDRVLILAAMVLAFSLAWPAFGPPARVRHHITTSYVHLGDNIFNPDYCRDQLGDVPHQLYPSGLVYANAFDTFVIREKHGIPRDAQIDRAEIRLYANEVDSTSPVTISINNKVVGYLNDFVNQGASCRRELVRITVPTPVLEGGSNTIVIQVGPKAAPDSQSRYEDIEFDNLAVDLLFQRELSQATTSRRRLAIVAASGLVFLVVAIGPNEIRALRSPLWRFFAASLSMTCAIATVLVPF